LTDALWKISRIDADGSVMHADGNTLFDNVATDLATVAGLTYA
jgi:hypothetical protein